MEHEIKTAKEIMATQDKMEEEREPQENNYGASSIFKSAIRLSSNIMEVFAMSTSLSPMVRRSNDRLSVSLRRLHAWKFIAVFVLSCYCKVGNAFEQIVISTGAPQGTEAQFIASMQAQWNVKVISNPLASNTYGITLYGPNPSYNPPITNAQLMQQIDLDAQYIENVDSYTYVYGWADGESYQQSETSNMLQNFMVQCSTPSVFVDTKTINSNNPWNSTECQEVLNAALQDNFDLSLSTPTIVPGEFQ